MKRILPIIVVALFASQNLGAQELTHARFLELHKTLRPSADELWRTIPWKISLVDAQHAAAESGKPMFVWSMDGHPLGCT